MQVIQRIPRHIFKSSAAETVLQNNRKMKKEYDVLITTPDRF